MSPMIYGPVSSWRLGASLGIDLLSTAEKTCSFDCLYCQLGRTVHLTGRRMEFFPLHRVIEEFQKFRDLNADYFTLSGVGEPTIASNLGEVIKAVRHLSKIPVAVLTNSSLISDSRVREELSLADFVIAKLDASDEKSFSMISRPAPGIYFDTLVEGLMEFRKIYKGKFALQIMLFDGNKEQAAALASLACQLDPDEVQLNTPLRPSPVTPLTAAALDEIKTLFKCRKVTSVYDAVKVPVTPVSLDDTKKRRPAL